MANRKFRNITVDDVKYAWSATHNFGRGGNLVRIWKDKKIVHQDDGIMISITPGLVAEIIKEKGL